MSKKTNLEDKLSKELKNILQDKPGGYITAVHIEPAPNKVLEYKNKFKTYSSEEKITKERIEETAKKVFPEIYDFFEHNHVQDYAFTFIDKKFVTKLTKNLIYELTSYPSIKRIEEPKLEPLSKTDKSEKKVYESIVEFIIDTIINWLAGT